MDRSALITGAGVTALQAANRYGWGKLARNIAYPQNWNNSTLAARMGYGGSGLRRGTPMRGTNRVYYRKYRRGRYKRRRMRYGTRIRKNALGLFEGKKHTELVRETKVVTNQVNRTLLMADLSNPTVGVVDGGDNIQTSVFAGRQIHVRGIKINALVVNPDVSQPIDCRIIMGWRKLNTSNAPNVNINASSTQFRIFKNTFDNKGGCLLIQTNHGDSTGYTTDSAQWLLANAPIDKKVFYCAKDISFRLGPNSSGGEDTFGSNTKRLNIWWELNNKRYGFKNNVPPTATADEIEKEANWFPVMYFYHVAPLSPTVPDPTIEASFWHSWTIYFKDPLG
jgi:hypothetical protein